MTTETAAAPEAKPEEETPAAPEGTPGGDPGDSGRTRKSDETEDTPGCSEHKLCAPCLFGLEGPLGNELRHMGLRDVMPENGRVRCTGTDADIARMNIRCRFGERVLLELGSFPAPTRLTRSSRA